MPQKPGRSGKPIISDIAQNFGIWDLMRIKPIDLENCKPAEPAMRYGGTLEIGVSMFT